MKSEYEEPLRSGKKFQIAIVLVLLYWPNAISMTTNGRPQSSMKKIYGTRNAPPPFFIATYGKRSTFLKIEVFNGGISESKKTNEKINRTKESFLYILLFLCPLF